MRAYILILRIPLNPDILFIFASVNDWRKLDTYSRIRKRVTRLYVLHELQDCIEKNSHWAKWSYFPRPSVWSTHHSYYIHLLSFISWSDCLDHFYRNPWASIQFAASMASLVGVMRSSVASFSLPCMHFPNPPITCHIQFYYLLAISTTLASGSTTSPAILTRSSGLLDHPIEHRDYLWLFLCLLLCVMPPSIFRSKT